MEALDHISILIEYFEQHRFHTFLPTLSEKSIPEVTPAPVIRFLSGTARSFTGSAPNRASWSSEAQCVVALYPFKSPAAPIKRDPVHTEVTSLASSLLCLINERTSSSSIRFICPGYPGTQITSSFGHVLKGVVG